MQPAYLPWLGYFHRIASSDIHIILDDVLIDRNSKTKFANRNRVRTKEGWTWLTVPLKTKGRSAEMFLNTLEIVDDTRWAAKHWDTIRCSYSRARFFLEHRDFFAATYATHWTLLPDLVRSTTNYLLSALGIATKILHSSEMGVEGEKSDLILRLCRAAGATAYISGPFGREYLRKDTFDAAGIRILYHDYSHPIYPQVYSGFEPFMSLVDLLFNRGSESLGIIGQGQQIVADSISPSVLARPEKLRQP
jgi:hypothetical protein